MIPSTFEFHAPRERVTHIQQREHIPRFEKSLEYVSRAVKLGAKSMVDLGCGDGGFMYLCQKNHIVIPMWGYDFTPSVEVGWKEFGVTAQLRDVFNPRPRYIPKWGDITITTEVLEHLADPHGAVKWIAKKSKFIVASSPWGETPASFDSCHVWAWDRFGYAAMIGKHFDILKHETAEWSQVILGRSKYSCA